MLNFKKKIIYRETYYINDSSIYRFEKNTPLLIDSKGQKHCKQPSKPT